jgi:preprotein translocase subunit SecE
MPPARTQPKAARAAAPKSGSSAKLPAGGKSTTGGSRFSRAFGRFNSAQRTGGKAPTNNVLTLIRDVRQEIRKVEWPSREEATKLTAAVVGLSAVVGVFLGGVDFLFQEIFKLVIGFTNGGV